MPLLIGLFRNRLSIGSRPPFHGPGVSLIKVLLRYLGPLRLSLLMRSSKLPMGHGHVGLPRCDKLADSFAKTGTTLLFAHVSSPLALVIVLKHEAESLRLGLNPSGGERHKENQNNFKQVKNIKNKTNSLHCINILLPLINEDQKRKVKRNQTGSPRVQV